MLAGLLLSSMALGESARQPGESALPTGTIQLAYSFEILSIPFGRADYTAKFLPGRYRVEMRFHTSGLAAALWKSEIATMAEGRAMAAGLLPERYTSDSLSHAGKHQSVRVDYTAEDGARMIAVPPYDLSHAPVSEAQKRGAVDPLTAITSMITRMDGAATRGACERTLPIFDGRRRYDIVFTTAAAASPLRVVRPEARLCKAEYRLIAGLKQEVVAVERVPAMEVELADISVERGRYTVALSIRSSFLWGAVRARLTQMLVNGHPMPLQH